MGREDFSQSSQLTTLVGKPTNRYKRLPKNVGTLKNLTQARAKPNNRLHHSAYPLIQKEYSATYTQLTNLDFYSPIITVLGNNPVSHLVGTPYVDAGVNVDEGSELYSTVSTVDTSEFGTYSVVYKARDGINADTTMTRVVKVGIPPDVTINGQNPTNLEKFDVYTDAGITVNDSNSTLIFTTSTVNNIEVGTYTVNYTVSNPAFTQVFSRTVRVDDTIPPVITITGGTPYELERFDPYVDEGATVDLGSELTNTDLSNVQNTAIGSFDVVYTAYDGNTTVTSIRTVNVVDTVPPVITITNNTLQGNTLERFDSYVDGGATVDLGSELTNTDLSNVQNTAVGAFDVVYTAYDGNTTVTATRTVTVVDTVPPVLTLIGGSPYNLQPGIDFETVDPGFSNDAGTVVTVDYSNASIIQNTSFDVVYRGNDGVHPDIVLIRRVSVADTLSPIVTINGDQVVTIERYSEYVDAGVTLDPGSSLVNGYPVSTVDNTATGTYTVTYLATDGINPDTTNVRTVHVVDTTPPIVFLNGADPLTMERFAVFSDIDPGVTYQSPHTGTVTSVDISQLDNTAIGGGTVTYNVVDDENNSNTISRAVTVVDTTPPVATLNNASTNYTLERYGDWSAIDPGVTVDVGSFVKQINIDNTTVGLSRPVEYVISDGNTLHDITLTRNITIEDTVPPYAELVGSNNIRVPLNSVWEDVDPGLQNFDAGSSLDYVSGFSNTNTNAQFVYYNLTDGVNSNSILRVVTCTLPSGTVNTSVSTTLERFETYVEPDEAIINIEDGYLARIDTSNVDSTAAHGTQQVIVYDLGDSVNNTLVTRTITVQDTTAPTGTVNPSVLSTLERFGTYVEPGNAIINMDQGTYIARIDTSNVDSTATHGTQQMIVYDLGDDVNSNLILTRTITIQDTVAPVITITNDTSQGNTLERFDEYVDEGATVDQGSQLTNTDLSNVQNTAIGSFDVVYTATDGVTTVTATRTVNVVDTVPPVITITNNTLQGNTLERLDEYVDEGATVDLGSQLTNTDLSNVQNTTSGTFDVVYTAYDGNTTVTATRTVTVVDTTAPVITLQGADPYEVERYSTYTDPGATADTGETVTNNSSTTVNNTASGTYTVTYSATDADGNTGTATRSVVVKDKTWTQLHYFTASNGGVADEFGKGVAIDGDYAVVGEWAAGPNNRGAAHVYRRTGTNTWGDVTTITASDIADGDYFGASVAISGDYIIVGSRNHDVNGTLQTGAAYVYRRTGTNTWGNEAKISAATSIPGAYFGETVAIDGDYAIVGTAPVFATSNAYIYHRTGTNTWGSEQRISTTDTSQDNFGSGVAISGDYAAVGDFSADPGSAGAVYVYSRTGTNTWGNETKIRASDSSSGILFGEYIAMDGDYLIVGARTHTSAKGAAYVYRRTGTNTWGNEARILASDGTQSDEFGVGVGISGDYLIVGSRGDDDGGSNTGAAYVYRRTGTNTWGVEKKITASVSGSEANFGTSVDIDGDDVIVGAWRHDVGSTNNAGAAYIFNGSL